MKEWSKEHALDHYQIPQWGEGHYDINDRGELCLKVESANHAPLLISLSDIINEMKNKKIALPAVIRFHDILRSRVQQINESFQQTIEEASYKGKYYGVYPIKVNQMREVVEEIVEAGSAYQHGLEAGSKTELMAVLSHQHTPQSLTIINGYKDKDYLRLACLAKVMGHNIVVVIEKLSEYHDLLEVSKEVGALPQLGLRAKLQSKGSGKWANSSGEKAKFGLSINEILYLAQDIKAKNLEHQLSLFHFHIGSQIPDITTIKTALNEGARIYAQLKRMKLNLCYFDVGGGVGVNYDGTQSNKDSSTNYSLQEYIRDVVYSIKDICDQEGVDHPHIVSESGRALTAHHSCVITQVFGEIDPQYESLCLTKSDDEHHLVQQMRSIFEDTKKENYRECYFDAFQKKQEAQAAFNLGVLSLEDRAKIESLFWKTSNMAYHYNRDSEHPVGEISDLKQTLAKIYLCNLSIFQSAADVWAINQVLPIVPIKNLNLKPEIDCTLADITCDSDGKIDHFIGPQGTERTLKLHQLAKTTDEYLIGIFMTGAYQDIMGDMHNLFGRLSEVHVYADSTEAKNFYIDEYVQGSQAQDILSIMQYSPHQMMVNVKKTIDQKIRMGEVGGRQGGYLVEFYRSCLQGLTYLDKSN